MKTATATLCIVGAGLCAVFAIAGPLNPPAGPVASTSPSLADIQAAIAGAQNARDTASTPGSATDGRPWPAPGEMRVAFKDGVPVDGFWTIADLAGEVEIIEFRLGGEENVILPLPGDIPPPAATLIRPISADLSASDWFQQIVAGNVAGARTDATLILYDAGGQEVAQWRLFQAWPNAYDTRIEGGAASEQLTIVMEGLARLQ
jgi:phage tail-like protein